MGVKILSAEEFDSVEPTEAQHLVVGQFVVTDNLGTAREIVKPPLLDYESGDVWIFFGDSLFFDCIPDYVFQAWTPQPKDVNEEKI